MFCIAFLVYNRTITMEEVCSVRVYQTIEKAFFAKEGEVFTEIALPHTWNAFDGQDGGGDYYRGTGIYKMALPAPTSGKRQYIEFHGANHIATVYCNGKLLGEHRGGFSTFRFELTDAMQPADNELTVEVFNGVCDVYPQRADFTFFGGIYRSTRFIEVEQGHFDLLKNGSNAVFVTPQVSGNTRIDLFPVEAEGCTVAVQLLDAQGTVVASGTADAVAHTFLRLDVEQPHLWHGMEDPYCYRAVATLLRGEEELDRVEVMYGYRSFHICPNTGFWLNGKNVPLRGVCRHQDRKDMGWAISTKEHDEDVVLIKEIGANTIRLAHYQHDQYFYDLCDKTGFALWAEIPYISKHIEGQAACENTRSQMKELIAQNYNHPSIFVWGICNEITIGGYCEELNDNMRRLHALCKTMDPSRLTTIAQLGSVPVTSDHVSISDVQSYNYYYGWYSGTVEQNGEKMDAWHAAHPDKCYGISEYGADNYTCWHSAAPFNHDYTEEYAVLYHHEMLKTFATRPYLWATHVWNMFDFAVDTRDEGGFKGLNAKGLVTFDRKIRKDSFYIYKAYWTKEPMVHISGRRFRDRAEGERNVTIITNEPKVTLTLNGQLIGTKEAVDHVAVFEDLPLAMGENTLVATTAGAVDTITLCGVAEHNTQYDLPDIMAAVNAGNWFHEQTDEGELENYYTIDTPGGQVLANEECMRLVRGWLMASEAIPFVEKMTVVSRLPNYQAMWGDRTISQIPAVKRLVPAQELELLDRMLRRVKKPE